MRAYISLFSEVFSVLSYKKFDRIIRLKDRRILISNDELKINKMPVHAFFPNKTPSNM